MSNNKGRLTLPSEANFLEETKTLLTRLGADQLRDSDGTKLPDEIKDLPADIVTTYFVARNHNEFAKANLSERQHLYLMSERVTATSETVSIPFMEEYFAEQIVPDYDRDPKAWWQVIDRTTGEDVSIDKWRIDQEKHVLTIDEAIPFHVYTVNFLAYANWDPTQMYNHITNDWGDVPKDIPFDVRGEKSGQYMEDYLRQWLKENPKTDIVRFTTFFYHFTLVFNKHGMEKFVDWMGYSASVSPEAFEAFEKVYGYKLKPEDIVDEGYYHSPFRVPSQAFKDYLDLTMQYVADRAKRLVDIVHEHGKKAIMFLGDNWIGIEPYGKYFSSIGLDGVVGSVGDGVTLRLIADIKTPVTEGRLLPYFFPDTFHPGGDPCPEAKASWRQARRAIFRNPVDRIGYGGYLSLAYQFPEFVDYMEVVINEFRDIHAGIESGESYKAATVAVLNEWGALRSWQPWIVAHAKFYRRAYTYMGILEALSGMDVNVRFISFDDVKAGIDSDIDVIINAGDAGTAWSGGDRWLDPELTAAIRCFVHEGGGFIGIGEPTAVQHNGSYFQLSDVLGVDRELGFSQSTNRYFINPVDQHFILDDVEDVSAIDFGEKTDYVYAIDEQTDVLEISKDSVHLAAKAYGDGRSVYIAGLPFTPENTRLLKRAIHFAAGKEDSLKRYFAKDLRLEVAAFPEMGRFAVYNNSDEPVESVVLDGKGQAIEVQVPASGLVWIKE